MMPTVLPDVLWEGGVCLQLPGLAVCGLLVMPSLLSWAS